MKIEWTPTGGAAVTLADDLNGKQSHIEQLGGEALEQLDPLAFATAVSRLMRGNLQGDCVFTAAHSHATRDAAATYFKGEYARIGQQGTLLITFDVATFSLGNATCRAVSVVLPDGLRWNLRYKFGITTIV